MSFGVTFPLALATGSLGYLEQTNDVVSAIESNVRALLLTNWGERVMRFDFGCNFREFLFQPRTRDLRAAIAARVNSQLAKWMPFIILTGLFILFPEDDPSVPDPGFAIDLRMTYGNVPVNLFVQFPFV